MTDGAWEPVEFVGDDIVPRCLRHGVGAADEEHVQPVLPGLGAAAQELQRRQQLVERVRDLDQHRRRAIKAIVLEVPMTIGWMITSRRCR